MKKAWSKIYREAARYIAEREQDYTCCAIGEQNKKYLKSLNGPNEMNLYDLPTVDFYLDLFVGPNVSGSELQRLIESWGSFDDNELDVRGLRVMLLCMAAAVVDHGN